MSTDKTSSAYSSFTGKSKIVLAMRGIFINKTFIAAIELDLFSILEEKPLTLEGIKKRLKLNGRGLNDFLDTLVSIGLLNRRGYGQNALYNNTEECSKFEAKGNFQNLPEKMNEMDQIWGKLKKDSHAADAKSWNLGSFEDFKKEFKKKIGTDWIIEMPAESKIVEAIKGIFNNKTMIAAIELDLFSILEGKPLTLEEIKKSLKLNDRGLNDFLDTLVSLDLLERKDSLQNAKYYNTKECSIFLNKRSPNDAAWWLPQKMNDMDKYWGKLKKALETGEQQRDDLKDKKLFHSNYSSEEKSRIFIGGMNLAQLGSFNDFAGRFHEKFGKEFKENVSKSDETPLTYCDVGGANGFLSIQIAKKNEVLKLITFDLAQVEKLAEQKIKEEKLSDRIKVKSGDFFKDEKLPKADIITMGFILHDWGLEKKKQLIAKAYAALPDGGAFVAIESFIDDERRNNTTGLLMSLHMLLLFTGGFDYTYKDLESWVKEAGFKKTETLTLDGDSDAVIAYK